ncbi:MAG: PDZ domain-containing protein [Chloroflexi bacterium]|nr:PDZ domain-containing protein [Chloroflexota bacterium]
MKGKPLLIASVVLSLLIVGASLAWTGLAKAAVSSDEQEPPKAHAWLGIAVAPVNKGMTKSRDLKEEVGLVILKVLKDSPAEKAGLKEKDVIAAVNRQAATMKVLQEAVKAAQPGDTIKLTIKRNGAEQTVDVVLGERPGQEVAKGNVTGAAELPLPGHLDRLVRAQVSMEEDGKTVTYGLVAGTITAVSGNSVTVAPKDGGASITVTITDETPILKGRWQRVQPGDLKADDKVIVITRDGTFVQLLVAPFQPMSPKKVPHQSGRGHSSMKGAMGNESRQGGGSTSSSPAAPYNSATAGLPSA